MFCTYQLNNFSDDICAFMCALDTPEGLTHAHTHKNSIRAPFFICLLIYQHLYAFMYTYTYT